MRPSLSSLSVVAASCFWLVAATGCKAGFSIPGANMLSWGKKPSPTALSSSTPKKPSSGALPGPSTTAAGSLASYPTGNYSNPGYSAQQGNAGGYYTGPYGTTSGSPAASGGYPTTAGNAYAGNSYAAGPYQSPYQSSHDGSASSGGGYATADARNSYYNNTAEPATNTSSSTSSSNNAWTAPQWRRGGDPYGDQVEPAGYGTTPSPYAGSSHGSYPSTPSNPAATYGAGASTPAAGQWTGGAATGYESGSTAVGETAAAGGSYRPGSTARNNGFLPSNSGSGTRSNSYPNTGAAPAGGSQPYGGGFSYPSTGQ